jgi:hypothetical protein
MAVKWHGLGMWVNAPLFIPLTMTLLKIVKNVLGKKSAQLTEVEEVQRALEDHNAWHSCDKLSILRRVSMAIASAYIVDGGECIAVPAIHLGEYQGKSCGEVLQG